MRIGEYENFVDWSLCSCQNLGMDKQEATDTIKFNIPLERKKRFRLACMLEDRNMSEVLNELIEAWLRENEPPEPPTGRGR